ncbi:WzyE family oligosaccharide polymerase [Paraburkholderia sp. Ac-20347]|uniref:WzyE family oligosaccharide polymerase n=1 Tax=Paraburkholderia sp. Ac-20347 TaxID=2703892 RepID=UPI001981778D|nr:WzyE family oligosaccharide polymerase [Paraburkholderia sp. Ac-20347]MBN3810612.1 hypothetical protein [Paraburkholderia sp. Ac-20347]
MEILVFLICSVALWFFCQEWRGNIGFVFFGITSIYVISILWIPYYIICNMIFNAGWDYPVRPMEFSLIGLIFCLAVLYSILGKRIFLLKKPENVAERVGQFVRQSRGRVFIVFGAIIAVVATLSLIASKGIALSVGNYGSRFESNTGTGFYSIFSYVVVPIATLLVVANPSRWIALRSLVIVVVYGGVLFLTLGGERNYLVAAVTPILLISYVLKLIDKKGLIVCAILGVLSIAVMALFRYGNSINSAAWLLIATYTRDTIFPVRSLNVILYSDHLRFVGFEYFFDQFYSVVPRFFWPGKPIYLDTIAYYFTEQIYAYGKGLIIAPTGIGSLYLMGGWLYVYLGVLVVISVFFIFDYLIFNCRSLFFICLWPALFFSFFSFRESVELGLFKILIHFVGVLLIYMFAKFIWTILPKKRLT